MSRPDDARAPADVRTREQFGAALTALRERSGHTVRDLARVTDIPFSTVGGYLSGRHLPTAGQVPRLRDLLRACGVSDPAEIDEWLSACARVRGSRHGPRTPSPYPGLEPYRAADADRFFGRAEATQRILDLIDGLADDPGPSGGILAVVGPSGSGKSSLLRAGVAAAIESGALDSADERWSCTVVTPGSDPGGALRAAHSAIADTNRGVVVLDQFEEVFTAVADSEVRAEFLHDLGEVARTIPVVIGLRADFYAAAARELALLPALAHAQVLVGPLGAEQLREVIVAPAKQAGVVVEDGLVDLLLSDLAPHDAPGHDHDAGSLPLLSHALLATWTRSDGERLAVADYRETGGIDGAVQRTAEQTFTTLSPAEQDLARRVFVRLVHLDDVAVTRRRVTRVELDDLRATDADAGSVIEAFVEARLLTASKLLVEISHEALLTAWPRLHEWVDVDRGGLRVHRQITNASSEWERLGRDPSGLARGVRLESMLEWIATDDHGGDLTDTEQRYIDASRQQRDADRVLARRRTQRLRTLAAAALTLAVVAGVLAVVALSAQSSADRNRHSAEQAGRQALSRQVALESRQMADTDPAVAQQLALAAYHIAQTPAARSALIDTTARPLATRLVGNFGYTPLAFASSRHIAAVGQASTGQVRLLSVSNAAMRQLSSVQTARGASVTGVAFRPDGLVLYVVSTSGRLDVWDVRNTTHPIHTASTALGSLSPRAVAVSPSGRQVAVGGAGPHPVQLYDVTGGPRQMPTPNGVPADLPIQTVAYDPDGHYLSAAGRSSFVYEWTLANPVVAPRRLKVGGAYVFSLLYSGSRLFIGDSHGEATLIDAATLRPERVLAGASDSWVLTLALSPDGRTLATGSTDSTLRLFSLTTYRPLATYDNPAQVTGATYLPDGSGLLLACGNGSVYTRPLQADVIPTPATTFAVDFDAHGQRVLTATDGDGGGVRLWRLHGRRPTPLTPLLRMTSTSKSIGTGALSPDGRLAAAGNVHGDAELFDLRDPAHPRAFAAPFRSASAATEWMTISPDGHTLAVAADDHTISLWNIAVPANPRLLARMRGGDIFYTAAWSSDGRLLAGANVDAHAYLWDVFRLAHPVLRARLGGFDQEVWGVAFSPSGRLLAATGSDHTTRLWDVSKPTAPRRTGPTLIGATDYAYAASFNSDGSKLAVASNDRSVRLYDLRSGSPTPEATLDAVGGNVFGVAFSPHGSTLIASGRSSIAPVWTADTHAAGAAVCSSSGSALTRSEWSQYVPGAPYDPPCR